jgi:hypothetical protein
VDGEIPDATVQQGYGNKELRGLQVRCSSLPEHDGDMVITNTIWCISTLCSKFKNASHVGNLNI